MQQFIVASVVGWFAVLYLTLFVVVWGAALQLARQNAALRDMVNRDVLTGIANSEHVASLAAGLAEELGLPAATRDPLRTAGLLHDVGKIGIPDRILRKPGRLTDEERRIVQQHVTLSEMIIQGIPRVEDVLDAVIHHHERWDGGGYSRGLAGERIPLLGRILAIADAYSAMTLDRPYRKGLSVAEALAELERGSGAQFDASLVAPFVAWARRQAAPLPEVAAVPAAVATPVAAAARAAA